MLDDPKVRAAYLGETRLTALTRRPRKRRSERANGADCPQHWRSARACARRRRRLRLPYKRTVSRVAAARRRSQHGPPRQALDPRRRREIRRLVRVERRVRPPLDTATGGLGSTTGMGICHSYAPDGRCISLLKILLTNFCLYDCRYCVNRRSSDVPRARFSRRRGRRPHARLLPAQLHRGPVPLVGRHPLARLHDGAAGRGRARAARRRTTSAATST